MNKAVNKKFQDSWQIILIVCIVSSVSLIILSSITHDRVISRYAVTAESSNIYIKLGRIIRRISEAESAQRGYLLTQDTSYLNPYNEALPELKNVLDELTAHYSEDESLDPRFTTILGNVQRKLVGMNYTIELAQQNKWAEAVSVIQTGLGKTQMDQILALTEAMRKEEQKIMDANAEQVRESVETSRVITIALATSNLFLLLWVILRHRRAAKLAAERESILDH